MKNATAHRKSSSDSAPKRDIKDRVFSNANAHRCFCKRCYVGIVIDVNRAAHNPAEPIRKWKIGPSFHLMRTTDPASLPIDRPAKADNGRDRTETIEQLGETRFNLVADPFAASPGINQKSPALQYRCLVIPGDNLQLRATGFDADEGLSLHS